MNIIGTTIPPLVFPPVDRVVRARVRVVEGLPFGLKTGSRVHVTLQLRHRLRGSRLC